MQRRIEMRILLVLAVIALLTSGCVSASDAVQQDQNTTNRIMEQIGINQPVPMFDWSQERDTAIQLYILRNEARNTYSIGRNLDGSIAWQCPSKGFPLPYDVQLTNPMQLARTYVGGQYVEGSVEQAEPNGLYSSKNTSATWVLCVRDNGDIVPKYWEGPVEADAFIPNIEIGRAHV
jgi:hypothetical protein